jgi:hypothetical protein
MPMRVAFVLALLIAGCQRTLVEGQTYQARPQALVCTAAETLTDAIYQRDLHGSISQSDAEDLGCWMLGIGGDKEVRITAPDSAFGYPMVQVVKGLPGQAGAVGFISRADIGDRVRERRGHSIF